jgi:hypothetical protein
MVSACAGPTRENPVNGGRHRSRLDIVYGETLIRRDAKQARTEHGPTWRKRLSRVNRRIDIRNVRFDCSTQDVKMRVPLG